MIINFSIPWLSFNKNEQSRPIRAFQTGGLPTEQSANSRQQPSEPANQKPAPYLPMPNERSFPAKNGTNSEIDRRTKKKDGKLSEKSPR